MLRPGPDRRPLPRQPWTQGLIRPELGGREGRLLAWPPTGGKSFIENSPSPPDAVSEDTLRRPFQPRHGAVHILQLVQPEQPQPEGAELRPLAHLQRHAGGDLHALSRNLAPLCTPGSSVKLTTTPGAWKPSAATDFTPRTASIARTARPAPIAPRAPPRSPWPWSRHGVAQAEDRIRGHGGVIGVAATS